MDWTLGYFGMGVVVVGLFLFFTWERPDWSHEHAIFDGIMVLMMTLLWGLLFWPVILVLLPMAVGQWLFRRAHPGKEVEQ